MPIKKILIVDDSATIRYFLLDVLVKAGYEIVTAVSGEEAIIKVKSEMPDLVLMDIVMPGINGFQATRAITKDEATKHIPVVILTSKDKVADRIWGTRQGAAGFIGKPVEPGALLAQINALDRSMQGTAY
jgi:twitching motility two-component system response regulator PilH